MKTVTDSSFFRFFTPAHRRPVDEHLLRDEATKKLLSQTENLLDQMIKRADGSNRKRTIRRKQREFQVRIKVTHKYIRVTSSDTKHSRSAIHKHINIICFRKYIKAKKGIGICREATIHYVKDGRSHVRSIRESSLFYGLFFRIHQLDEAYVHGSTDPDSRKELLAIQEQRLLQTQSNDLTSLYDESRRYVDSVKHFSIDPLIEGRLIRLLDQVAKLRDDFDLLDYEEKHTVRRMLKEDIPKLLNTFLSLSLKHQLEQKESVFIALTKMELTIIDFQKQLEKARVERMNHLLRLQDLRYNRDSK